MPPFRKGPSGKGTGKRRGGAFLLSILLFSAAILPARAQDRKKTWELGAFLGLTQFGSEAPIPGIPFGTAEVDTDFLGGTRVGYNLTNHIQVEAVWDVEITQFKDPLDLIAVDFTSTQLNLLYNFRRALGAGADPYLLLGIGKMEYEVEIPRIPFTIFTDPISLDESDNMILAGLGLRIFGTERFGFRFELKQKRYTFKFLDADALDHEFTFGLVWSIGHAEGKIEEEEIPLDLD